MGRKKREPNLTTYSGRVAARLREFRESQGWSIEDVVSKLEESGTEIGVSAYYRYENGYRILPPDLYPVLAEIFNKTVRNFLPPK